MADTPADVIRVWKNTQADFVGEALKKKQKGVCLNTDQPELGIQEVYRLPTGEYEFKDYFEDTPNDSLQYVRTNGVWAIPLSSGLNLTNPAIESLSGTASELNTARQEDVTAINQLKEDVQNLSSASMELTQDVDMVGIASNEASATRLPFAISQPSDNTDLLDANEVGDYVILKGSTRRYEVEGILTVVNSSQSAIVTINICAFSQNDNTRFGDVYTIDIEKNSTVPLNLRSIRQPPSDNFGYWYGFWATSGGASITVKNTTVIANAGSGAISSPATLQTVIDNDPSVNTEGYSDDYRVMSFLRFGERFFSVFAGGIVAILEGNIEKLGSSFGLFTTELKSLGKTFLGKETDLGAVVNIDRDSADGYLFSSSPNDEPADGLYTDQGDGTQNGSLIYRISGGGYFFFRMLVSGQLYWAISTTVVDGDAQWNNVLYRQTTAGLAPDGTSFEGLIVNGAENTQGGSSLEVDNPVGLASNLPMKLKVTPDGSDLEDIVNEERLQQVSSAGAEWTTLYDGTPVDMSATNAMMLIGRAVTGGRSGKTEEPQLSGIFRVTITNTTTSDIQLVVAVRDSFTVSGLDETNKIEPFPFLLLSKNFSGYTNYGDSWSLVRDTTGTVSENKGILTIKLGNFANITKVKIEGSSLSNFENLCGSNLADIGISSWEKFEYTLGQRGKALTEADVIDEQELQDAIGGSYVVYDGGAPAGDTLDVIASTVDNAPNPQTTNCSCELIIEVYTNLDSYEYARFLVSNNGSAGTARLLQSSYIATAGSIIDSLVMGYTDGYQFYTTANFNSGIVSLKVTLRNLNRVQHTLPVLSGTKTQNKNTETMITMLSTKADDTDNIVTPAYLNNTPNLQRGATTSQTAEENIAVGDQGLLSIGGAKLTTSYTVTPAFSGWVSDSKPMRIESNALNKNTYAGGVLNDTGSPQTLSFAVQIGTFDNSTNVIDTTDHIPAMAYNGSFHVSGSCIFRPDGAVLWVGGSVQNVTIVRVNGVGN